MQTDLHAAYYCASALIRRRQRTGEPIPTWLRRHHAQLDAEIRGLSRPRRRDDEIDGQRPQLEKDLIGTKEAARLLSWSTKKVERNKAIFGGRLIGGSLVFDRSVVLEYARKERNG